MQVFISTGTYTPTAGTTSIIVHCVGGGGGSGSSRDDSGSGGGGGAGVAIRSYNATELGNGASVIVGAGGAAGAYYNGTNGGNGGNSSFNPNGTGATITGGGGSGSTRHDGDGNGNPTGGAGGSGNGGNLNLAGESGFAGDIDSNASTYASNNNARGGSFHQTNIYWLEYDHHAAAGFGGYGQYGLGAGGTRTFISGYWREGTAGNGGVVIIYEF